MENPIFPLDGEIITESKTTKEEVVRDTEVAIKEKKDVNISLNNGKFEFQGFSDIMTFSKHIANSTLVPNSFRGKHSDVAVCIAMGIEKGLTPFQSLSSICVINGRPAIWGDALIGLAQKTGELESLKVSFNDEKRKTEKWACTVSVKRKNMTEPCSYTYSWEQAIDAGSINKPVWKSHPERMLESKARAYALRTAFADVFCGLYTVEEMQEVETTTKDVTPKTQGLDELNGNADS